MFEYKFESHNNGTNFFGLKSCLGILVGLVAHVLFEGCNWLEGKLWSMDCMKINELQSSSHNCFPFL